ncbi:hypothetical protein DYBT9275_04496 [Dyadobacter sp. CECT 9275]|uniref:Lipocalin-like domain-containing protein n=1 Tax=Dyadobacter helix TaxID=2822344 RepID=A0A916JFD2_9BACT|nr:hypothetical protein [Dyadobacter sp. CECT 9275]CAG5009429.1 hypothetical protein DYBT9275_04496 [Dyadobacter sp. CECT 9275]
MKNLLLSLITILFIASCSKKDVDVRDQYVGTWKYKSTGGVNTYNNGQIAESLPWNDNGTLTISKSGENGLLIDEKEFILEGDQLTADSDEMRFNTPLGASVLALAETTGEVSSGKITYTSSIEGTWTFGSSRGPVAGEIVTTMTK